MSDSGSFEIVAVGIEEAAWPLVKEIFGEGANFTRIDATADWEATWPGWNDSIFNAAICGPGIVDLPGSEIAQILQVQCPTIPRYYLTLREEGFEPRNLIKNGITQVFRLPIDKVVFKATVTEEVLSAVKKVKTFRAVRVLDLDAGDELDFSTYLFLPLNKKYVRYTASDQPVPKEKLEKLQSHDSSQLWVDAKEMGRFYQFSARKFRELGEGGVGNTEKQEKLKNCVRTLFNDIFDQSVRAEFDQGKELMSQCQNIVAGYVNEPGSKEDGFYRRLMRIMADSNDPYNHTSNVSTFAALFAIGIGNPNVEDLAIAGLLHDIGMSQLPPEIQNLSERDLEEKDKRAFYAHVENGINILKNRKIVISATCEKAIMQHHESYSGRGWPKRLASDRICEEAQILSFADQFDELTRLVPGKPQVTPLAAIEKIRLTQTINPVILSRISRLLDPVEPATKAAA